MATHLEKLELHMCSHTSNLWNTQMQNPCDNSVPRSDLSHVCHMCFLHVVKRMPFSIRKTFFRVIFGPVLCTVSFMLQ